MGFLSDSVRELIRLRSVEEISKLEQDVSNRIMEFERDAKSVLDIQDFFYTIEGGIEEARARWTQVRNKKSELDRGITAAETAVTLNETTEKAQTIAAAGTTGAAFAAIAYGLKSIIDFFKQEAKDLKDVSNLIDPSYQEFLDAVERSSRRIARARVRIYRERTETLLQQRRVINKKVKRIQRKLVGILRTKTKAELDGRQKNIQLISKLQNRENKLRKKRQNLLVKRDTIENRLDQAGALDY